MYINNSSVPKQWGGSTYDSANRVGTHPADVALEAHRAGNQAGAVKDAALSALHNHRFGSMLDKISDPVASDALMLLGRDTGAGSGADHGSVLAAYGENS